MSEIIERVKVALHTYRHSTPEVQARAAIAALREPTPKILEAMSGGFEKEPSRDDPMPHHLQRQRNALQAFIDVALTQTNTGSNEG